MSDPHDTSSLPLATLDSSETLQDETAPRLPTASQGTFCEPCKAFLRGDRTDYGGNDKILRLHEYVHHIDANSFQDALQLPCHICIRLHKAFNRSVGRPNSDTYLIAPTRYGFDVNGPKPINLLFLSHEHIVFPDLEAYETRPDLHHQHITKNTGDGKALSFLVKQYQRCRNQHPKCQLLAPSSNFMPTRVIYVGSTEEAVRLCDTARIIAGRAYTVLSHCWGENPQHTMLTKSTVDKLKEGIPWSSLSKTFQDAITVARTFQIQYIWIDSLCIFQDDLDDWATEASLMRDVYSKAEFCIAATAADSGDVGLFLDRDNWLLTPVVVDIRWPFPPAMSGSYLFGFLSVLPDYVIDFSPLNSRAWVAQERFLSPRILHFTEAMLFWECHTAYTSENYTKTDIDPRFVKRTWDPNALKRLLNDTRCSGPCVGSMQNRASHPDGNCITPATLITIYRLWQIFLVHYTRYDLTEESDILVAIAGIAYEVGHVLNDSLVAGLWKAHFIQDMCWRSNGKNPRPSILRAPSWSWASTLGSVCYSRGRTSYSWHNMATVVEFYVPTKQSEDFEQGSVLLECRPIATGLCHIETPDGDTWGTLDKAIWPFLKEASHDEDIDPTDHGLFQVFPDARDASCYHAQDWMADIQLIVLQRRDYTEATVQLDGVCVVNSGNQEGAFGRIGYFDICGEAARLVQEAYFKAWVQTIVLV